MRIIDLLETVSLAQDLKRQIKDALVAIKVSGINKIKTDQVLDEFSKQGIDISFDELVNIIGDDPLIYNISKYEIEFSGDEDLGASSEEKQDDDEEQVEKLAKKALNKRM